MKKLLLTLIVSLACCGSIFAQYESHWPDFYYPAYDSQTALVAAIELDGAIVTAEHTGWDALEIAFFVGDQCRGAGVAFGDYTPSVNYLYNGYVVDYGDPFPIIDGAPVYYNGNSAGETVTVKMFDHLNNIEYNECTVTLLGEPYIILTGGDNIQGWFDPENPIILHFTTPAPALNEFTWNVNEPGWTEPESGANVIIPDNSVVTIPDGVVAIADQITMGTNSQIIIEDGGELYHSNEVPVTFQMNVDGYQATRDENPDNDGYRLIASPVYESNTNPASIDIPEAMLEGNYDLYYFDQTQELEWINHKVMVNNQHQFTTLDLGKGYLYANTANVFVAFVGQTTPTNFPIGLDMVYEPGHVFTGWNFCRVGRRNRSHEGLLR